MTLTNDKVWTIGGFVHVKNGATLTIPKCTRLEGTQTPIGVLVITRGSKLIADGTADEPILFTSPKAPGARAAGDWGGVVLLGKANNNNPGGEALIEATPAITDNTYGGGLTPDDADNSGTLRYVRIEFAGYELAADKEVNGLTLGAVGSGTTLSHIEVSNGRDDCFEWFGGTVNADHLICNTDGDDTFDTDRGYRGTVQYAFGRKFANPSKDPQGFEWDNYDANNAATPKNQPIFKNITLCGYGVNVDGAATKGPSFAGVFRKGIGPASIDSWVATGFDYGIDFRDAVDPTFSITNSFFFGMFKGTGDQVIAPTTDPNAETGVDELTLFKKEGAGNVAADAGPFTAAECNQDGAPAASVTSYTAKGAFAAGSNWQLGKKWVDWSKN